MDVIFCRRTMTCEWNSHTTHGEGGLWTSKATATVSEDGREIAVTLPTVLVNAADGWPVAE